MTRGETQPALAASPQNVLILGLDPNSLINFRRDLILCLMKAGHRVTVASQKTSPAQKAALEVLGVDVRDVFFSRGGMNPLKDVYSVTSLVSMFRDVKPATVIAYTPKPVVYGALAARIAGVPRFVAMITGLGYSFIEGPELKRLVARHVAIRLFKLALKRAYAVIFQNTDDRMVFLDLDLISPLQRVGVVNGSGVDVQHFDLVDLPSGPAFLMVSRLLADKGIHEYVAAAARLRKTMPGVRTMLAGGLDPSPNSLRPQQLHTLTDGGLEYLGQLSDVRPAIAQARVLVLPSYREGTPRSVLEGMAMGRAIVTTDVPGCRETVMAGVNGILVPARNADALFEALMKLASDPELVRQMGKASRQMAVEKFEGKQVARSIMEVAGL